MKNTEPRDFSTPRRMGWEALIVIMVNAFGEILKNLWILIIPFVFGNGIKEGRTMLYFLCGLVILSFINPLSRYFTTTIQIKDGKIITRSGLFYKQVKTIPLNRIHALRTKSGPIYQAVDMIGVFFDTIAEKGQELEFILSEEDWQMMLSLVSPEEMMEVQKQIEMRESREKSKVVYRMSPIQIIKGTLVQNHLKGLWMIVLAFWYLFSQLSDYSWIMDKLLSYAEAQFIGVSIVFYLMAFIFAYIAGLIVLCAAMLMKYWGLQITFHKNRLEYEAGLFTHKTVRIHRDKVIGLSTKKNYFERKLGLITFKFKQASNALGLKGDEELAIIGMDKPQMILDCWNEGHDHRSTDLVLSGHSQFGLFWRHLFSRCLFFVIVVVIAITSYKPILYGLIPLLMIFGFEGWKRFRKSKIEIFDDCINVYSGFFANQILTIPMDRIERIERRQLNLLGISFSAGHLTIMSKGEDITVRSLRLDTLAKAYDYLLFRATCK
ncbi:PH domain-containing protein [Porphyromonadaceae bacterium W3.11]|nr:PH domain-containing protein [Porphyromonadaceae bacterium W3.11]